MAIYLAVVRVGVCEICQGEAYLPEGQIPEKCIHCGSRMWLYGFRTDRESGYIRQGIFKSDKPLNKGVTSAKRQQQGLKQWRRFKSKDDQKVEGQAGEGG